MDFIPLRLNFSRLSCSICALAAIILQFVAIECQKLHIVDSPIVVNVSNNNNTRRISSDKAQGDDARGEFVTGDPAHQHLYRGRGEYS